MAGRHSHWHLLGLWIEARCRPHARMGVWVFLCSLLPVIASARGGAEKDTPHQPTPEHVKAAVLLKIRKPTKQQIEAARRLVISLAEADAEQRDRLMQQLLDDPASMLTLFGSPGMRKLELPKEVESRLDWVDEHPLWPKIHERYKAIRDTIERGDLASRPEYLISLLADTEGPDRRAVVRRLESVTHQTLGDDVRAWKVWWKDQPCWGKLDELSPATGRLIGLRFVLGTLRLDRARWSKARAAVTYEQLQREVQEAMIRSGSDTDWAARRSASRAKYAMEGPPAAYALLRFAMACGSYGYGRRTSGDDYASLSISGALPARVDLRGGWIRIVLEERAAPRRRLAVTDDGDGAVRVVLSSLSDGSMTVLDLRADGGLSFARTGPDGEAACTAKSFAAFWRQEAAEAARLKGMLGRVGIDLPKVDVPQGARTEAAGAAGLRRDGESAEAATSDGPLREGREDVGGLLALTGVGRRLCFDRSHWADVLAKEDQAALTAREQRGGTVFEPRSVAGWPKDGAKLAENGWLAFERFKRRCEKRGKRGGGGSGSTTGGGRVRADFSIGGQFRADFAVAGRGSEVSVSLEEQAAPRRRLSLMDEADGTFRLELIGVTDGSLLLIHQAPGGRFSVAEIRGGALFVAGAESFLAFCRRFPRRTEDRILGHVRRVGVLVPPHPYSARARDAVASTLGGDTKRDRDQARRLIAELDADEYRRREQATQSLLEHFYRYHRALTEARKANNLTPEQRTRLGQIFAEAAAPRRMERLVSQMRLTADAEYLVDLLGGVDGEQRQAIAQRLAEVTGEKLGPDVNAWCRWLAGRSSK